jgi:radical SAM protein with 4Fe4S-binding SPASM domain
MGRGPSRNYHHRLNDAYVDGSLTCLRPEVIARRMRIDFPLVLNIEPTNACNLRCTICPRAETVRRQGIHHLSLADFKKIIDEARAHGRLIMLNLHKDGEPLLHRQLPEMVAYAKEKKVAETIHLNTNGTLLDQPIARKLLAAGIDDITVSVDAAWPETYHRIKQDWDLNGLNRKIEAFLALRDRMRANTFVRVKIMEFNWVTAEEITAFHRHWEGIADQVQVTGVHDWSGAIADLAITDETVDVRYPCALLWYALAVNSNGKVSICNVDWDYSGVVGDVYQKSLSEIWNDQPLRGIRRAHLEQKWNTAPVCDSCVVWVSFGDMTGTFLQRRELYSEVHGFMTGEAA